MNKEQGFDKISEVPGLRGQEKISYFDKCYADLHQAVYRNIVKFVHDHTIAEDLLQDVFLAFWENMYKIDPDRVANWLFVVSYNKSVNSLKNARKFRELGEIEIADEIEIDEADFEYKLQLIDQAVDLLPGRKKEIFRMYRLEGKSLHEISSQMQLSVHTIKDHLKIARKLIRAYLNQNHLHNSSLEFLFLLFLLR